MITIMKRNKQGYIDVIGSRAPNGSIFVTLGDTVYIIKVGVFTVGPDEYESALYPYKPNFNELHYFETMRNDKKLRNTSFGI